MQRHSLDAAAVDACPRCAGVWVDWFDGEIATVVEHLVAGQGRRRARAPAPVEAPEHPACPRCYHRLGVETYRGDGPVLLRCCDCGGAFVPRASFAELLAREAPEPAAPSGVARLLALLRRLYG